MLHSYHGSSVLLLLVDEARHRYATLFSTHLVILYSSCEIQHGIVSTVNTRDARVASSSLTKLFLSTYYAAWCIAQKALMHFHTEMLKAVGSMGGLS